MSSKWGECAPGESSVIQNACRFRGRILTILAILSIPNHSHHADDSRTLFKPLDQASHLLPQLTNAPNKHTVTMEHHCGIPETPRTSVTRLELIPSLYLYLWVSCVFSYQCHFPTSSFLFLPSPCPCVEE
jgi:hypothetical protein